MGSLSFTDRVKKIISEAFPQLIFGYPRTYLVQSQNSDGSLNLAPPPGANYLPPLASVQQWSLGGATVSPSPGSSVCVMFRDADPSRPIVAHFDATTPSGVTFGQYSGGSPAPVGTARNGDTVTNICPPGQYIGQFVGTISGSPATGAVSGVMVFPVNQFLGNITSASTFNRTQ